MSGSSPTTGAAKAEPAGEATAKSAEKVEKGEAGERARTDGGRLKIEFEVLRGRSAGWAAFGLIAGALLVAVMGTVAQWIGIVLIAVGGIAGWSLARTFLFPAAAIVVDDDGVSLPRAQCTKSIDRMPMSAVTAAYFLRRSVPWTRAAPVLVVEADGKAYAYPRDWFVNEAEQRQIIHAILGRIRPESVTGLDSSKGRSPRMKP